MENKKRIEDMTEGERLEEAKKMCDGTDVVIINGLRHKRIKGTVEEYAKLVGAIPIEEFQWTK